MEHYAQTESYELGNGGSLVFERDLFLVSEKLERPPPQFHGVRIHNTPEGEQRWMITADLKGSPEPPMSERILFSFKARKDLELTRVHATVPRWLWLIMPTPSGYSPGPRVTPLRRAKKDATISRLREKIRTLEITVRTQQDQIQEMEEDGEDIQGGDDFLSDDNDFEEDEFTEEEDYEFLESERMGSFPSMWMKTMRSSCTSFTYVGLIKKMRDEFRESKGGMSVVEYRDRFLTPIKSPR
ncbi:hypothetical protein QYE76_054603 [Lolium multiflorum]|uniref:Uncharacterized protein n=1 Tax=Lolium multiflorum TaxID=4521 RepID=A0AAD8WL56_LOLMU|nr:hypothetical protein QYE76_054603 [Lolium multiflorum]